MNAGVTDSMLRRILGNEERYFGKVNRAAAGKFIADRIKNLTRREVLFVAGELAPRFYESPEFMDAVLALLERLPRVVIKIICGKPADLIEKMNPFLWGLVREKRIIIHIASTRPKYHFICIDGRSLFLEAIHDPGHPCETYFMENAGQIAQKYREKFLRTIGSGKVPKLEN